MGWPLEHAGHSGAWTKPGKPSDLGPGRDAEGEVVTASGKVPLSASEAIGQTRSASTGAARFVLVHARSCAYCARSSSAVVRQKSQQESQQRQCRQPAQTTRHVSTVARFYDCHLVRVNTAAPWAVLALPRTPGSLRVVRLLRTAGGASFGRGPLLTRYGDGRSGPSPIGGPLTITLLRSLGGT